MKLGEKVAGTHVLCRIVGREPTHPMVSEYSPIEERYGRSHPLHSTGYHYAPFDDWRQFKGGQKEGQAFDSDRVSWWLRPFEYEGIVVAKSRGQWGEIRFTGWQDPSYFNQRGSFGLYYVARDLGPTTQFLMIPEGTPS